MDVFTKKLDHVRFSELNNQIVIKNKKISIPKMEIKSDVLNIYAEGDHWFDNQIDYSIGFDIADLARKNKYSDDEKGLSKLVFVSMTGTTSDPKFGYDQLAVKEQRKENRDEEKEKLRDLIKNEFSKNSPEEGDVKAENMPQKDNLTIEWAENNKKQPVPTNKKKEDKKVTFTIKPSSENEDDDDF